MLRVGSSLKGYKIEASDGSIGHVSDLLFDDKTWKIRWLVVDAGSWLTDRQVLLHPSSIVKADYLEQVVVVSLTKAQVKDSPPILHDQPVSRQMQDTLFTYYGWDPFWGGGPYEYGGLASPFAPAGQDVAMARAANLDTQLSEQDQHLRSMSAVTGYHCHATDGALGHVEDFMVDDTAWNIQYLIIDTKNWWPGEHVLLSPAAVTEIGWSDRIVRLNVDRAKVKDSPPWSPAEIIDRGYQQQLHLHYAWPGYGW